MENRKVIQTGTLYRSATFDRAAGGIDAEARTVKLAFSSEEPYRRHFGTEILDHAPASIRLGRLTDGGALLLDHDMRRHIGVVEQVTVGNDRVGRAIVRFGKGAEAEAAFRDVQDGIRRHVSVGYQVHRMVMEEAGDDDDATYRATDWEPIEISLVAIPADPTVGVGRNAGDTVDTVIDLPSKKEVPPMTTTPATAPAAPSPAPALATTVGPDLAAIEKRRVDRILAYGEQYADYGVRDLVAAAIRNNVPAETFADTVMEKISSKHTSARALEVGLTPSERQRYSFGRAIRAATIGSWADAGFELECSRATEKIVGNSPEGFFVPWDVWRRDFNVGTATEAGNLVPTDLRPDLFVDALRNAIVLPSLGVRILSGLSGNVDIPQKATPTTLGMVTEVQALTEGAPVTAKLTLSPKRLGAFVEYSKRAIIQSAIGLEDMLRDDLLQGAAVLIENQAINGAGTGANMLGIRNYTNLGGTVAAGANGLAPAWSHVVDLETKVADVNAEPDRLSGYLINTKLRGKLKQTQKGTNLPFIWDNGAQPLNGYRAAVTNNVPSNLTKGTSTTICSAAFFAADWSMAVLAFFGAPDVTVDPLSLATTGQVRITLNQFADFGLRNPTSFAEVLDLLA